MANDISIMMVTYNRLELTRQTVDNIYLTTGLPFNFIIIDNASSDGTQEYLQDLQGQTDNIHLIFNKTNKGIGAGRNAALKKADELKTVWHSTVDNDVLLPNNWLEECIDILKNNSQYGMIGVNFENVNYPLVTWANDKVFQVKPSGNLGTACTVFHNRLHQTIGFFNCKDYAAYGEDDADWGWRTRVCGYKLGYIKENGIHIGEGENDTGAYREFKDECRKSNLEKFYNNCRLYSSGKKPIYIKWEETE